MSTSARIYPAINNFKLPAALLVIAIHTSPLTSLSVEADFILTRILARVAVPFFFLVTGYFVLPRAIMDNRRALSYLKRMGLIYLASLLLYLPVGIYAGHFEGSNVLSLLKMIFLDGTFYHLWYLPALLLGFGLTLLMLRTLPFPASVGISCFLYVLGLLGDSYYGLIEGLPILGDFYRSLFRIFTYTRNGLFYAPVFLMMGCALARQASGKKQPDSAQHGGRPSPAFSLAGIGIFSALLLTEGITLRLLNVQRHDSMYLSLLPLMYFLFSALLDTRGTDWTRKLRMPKELPLLVYILHPLFIILVRGGAKLVHMPAFISNSLLHFAAVSVTTLAFSWGLLLLLTHLKNILYKRNI